MNCCEQSGTGAGCNQGRNCPVRATRNAGVCTPEPDEQHGSDDAVVTVTLIVAAYTVICGWLGYLWGTHGAAIEAFLWALASKLF